MSDISMDDFLKLKYELTYELKQLTETVNRLAQLVEQKFNEQDDKIKELSCANTHTERGNNNSEAFPSSLKWLLIVILGVAFLGTLGAAIGINLLEPCLTMMKGA